VKLKKNVITNIHVHVRAKSVCGTDGAEQRFDRTTLDFRRRRCYINGKRARIGMRSKRTVKGGSKGYAGTRDRIDSEIVSQKCVSFVARHSRKSFRAFIDRDPRSDRSRVD
jgi:hypothetical protein